VEGHERHHVSRGRAGHGLVGRGDPLDSIGEGRKLARLDQTEELLVRDVGARLVQHHGGEVLGELEAQAAAVLWMRMNLERKGKCERKKKQMGRQSPEPTLGAPF
jgi:hypothetical protein